MTDSHPDPSVELRRLVKAVLGVVTSLGEAAAAVIPRPAGEHSSCQRVWCPLCAMAALAQGEHHALTTIIAEHGTALLSILRAVADTDDLQHQSDEAAGDAPPGNATTGYQPIPVIVEE